MPDFSSRRHFRCVLASVHHSQKPHNLITDFGRGLVLNPMAHMVYFDMPHETRKAGNEAIRLSLNIEGRLPNRCTFVGAGQIEIRFGGTVVIQQHFAAPSPQRLKPNSLSFMARLKSRPDTQQTHHRLPPSPTTLCAVLSKSSHMLIVATRPPHVSTHSELAENSPRQLKLKS